MKQIHESAMNNSEVLEWYCDMTPKSQNLGTGDTSNAKHVCGNKYTNNSTGTVF
jgi:hypothetical protein